MMMSGSCDSTWSSAVLPSYADATSVQSHYCIALNAEDRMPINITDVHVRDIRMPTSRTLAGSDAMHTDPDYSATYVVLDTDGAPGVQGHGLTFTLGRGNEVIV